MSKKGIDTFFLEKEDYVGKLIERLEDEIEAVEAKIINLEKGIQILKRKISVLKREFFC